MVYGIKKIRGIVSIGMLLSLAGCDQFLSHEPDLRTQINTKEKISELLVSAYPEGNYIPFCETMTGNVIDHGTGSTDYTNSDPYFWDDVRDIEQDSPDFYWASCYTAIAAANHALEIIHNSEDPTQYNPQKGEALLARAYSHLMLVSLFSKMYDPETATSDLGIPYVTEPEKQAIKRYERRTVAYVYDRIEKDITQGIPLIRDELYTVPAYHFTRAAAHALATRFYLFKQDYDKVVEHADMTFTDGNLAGRLRPWNTVYNDYAFDQIITVYTSATDEANLLLSETLSLWARYYNSYRYSPGPDNMDEINSIENIVGGQFSFPVFFYSTIDAYFLPKWNEHFVRDDISADIGLPYTIVPLLTTEEVLLNRAEAQVLQGNFNAALSDLNTYFAARIENYSAFDHTLTVGKALNYYQLTNTPQNIAIALLNTTLDLRRVEFVHEGLRWFDILRYDIPVIHYTAEGEKLELPAGDSRRVLQIPSEAVTQAGLTPNPR